MTEPYTPDFLIQQAKNTQSIREFLYRSNQLSLCSHVLDVGCGEGQITRDLVDAITGVVIGLDKDPSLIKMASCTVHHRLQYLVADAHHLPLKNDTICLAQFHFVLMWTKNPLHVLRETKRVLMHQGVTIAIESDYSGRIENLPSYQPSIPKSSMLVAKKLQKSGADPFMGHRLPSLFQGMNFTQINFGVLSWEYNQPMANQSIQNDHLYIDHNVPDDLEYRFTFTPVFWIVGTT